MAAIPIPTLGEMDLKCEIDVALVPVHAGERPFHRPIRGRRRPCDRFSWPLRRGAFTSVW